MTVQHIDMTPSWEQTAHILAVVFEAGTQQGKDMAKAELIRMGQLLDKLLTQAKTDANQRQCNDDWVECDAMSDDERKLYLSPDCPEGYDTVMGYLARYNPWALKIGLDDPEATQRDGYWLKHRASERGIKVVKVSAPDCFADDGIEQVNAYPVSLLRERLEA